MNHKQRIVSNLLIMGVGQVVTFGLSLVYVILISRYLGPDRFGELTLAKAVVVMFWLGGQLGMTTLITRTVARTPERAGALVSAAMIVRSALALPVLAAIVIYVHIAHLDAETSLAAYLYGTAEILWELENVMLAAFQGRENMSLATIWTIATRVSGLGLGLLIIWRHGSVAAFAATDLPAAIVLFFVTLRWMRRFGRLTRRVSRADLREVMVGGLAFWANDIFSIIYLYIDTVILAGLVGTRAVGIYRPATQLFNTTMFLTNVIGPVTLPLLSRLGIDASADFKRAGRKTLSFFIVCAVPLTLGTLTFAGPLILTIFGPAYRLSVPVLMALGLCIFPMFLNFQFSQLLTASDRQWRWTLALAACCVVNPAFNFVLIPFAQHTWHNGALGAALAWLAMEILEVIYGIVLLRDVLFDRTIGRVTLAALAAGAAQAAVLWATIALWPPLGEALGVAAFGVVAVALGALPRGDIILLLDTISSRIRGRRVDTQVTAIE